MTPYTELNRPSTSALKYIPAPPRNFVYTAGAHDVVIVRWGGDKKTMERWSLATFTKEMSAPIPGMKEKEAKDGRVGMGGTTVAMGSASDGPVLLCCPLGPMLVDVDSLERIEIAGVGNLRPIYDRRPHLRAAEDGSAFVLWHTGKNTRWQVIVGGLQLLTFRGNTAKAIHYEKTAACESRPTSGGHRVYSCNGTVRTSELKPVQAGLLKGARILPVGNSLVLAVRGSDPSKGLKGLHAVIHEGNEFGELFTIPDLHEMKDYNKSGLEFDKHFHFVPAANVLVMIPRLKDRLIVRCVDVDQELDKSGRNYLLITSVPPAQAVRGKMYRYAIATKSNSGDVRFTIESGPEGMSVTAEGVITWRVPADHEANTEAIIVQVVDASGEPLYHSFDLNVAAAR